MKRDPETEKVIAAAIEVHRHLGPGLLESVYVDALCYEFELRGIQFVRQKQVNISYKGRLIRGQRIDLICLGCVVVEVKAQKPNGGLFEAQIISYLKCTGLKRGLVINFGLPKLVSGITRFANSY